MTLTKNARIVSLLIVEVGLAVNGYCTITFNSGATVQASGPSDWVSIVSGTYIDGCRWGTANASGPVSANILGPGTRTQYFTTTPVGFSIGVNYIAIFYTSPGGGTTIAATGYIEYYPYGRPPTIISQSTSTNVFLNSTVTLDVQVAGDGPFTYLWSKDNALVQQGPVSSLQIQCTSTNVDGRYTVIVTNRAGTATSSPIGVVILPEYVDIQKQNALRLTWPLMTNTTYALERSTNGIQWSDVTAITTSVSASDNLAYDIVCDAAMGLYRLKRVFSVSSG